MAASRSLLTFPFTFVPHLTWYSTAWTRILEEQFSTASIMDGILIKVSLPIYHRLSVFLATPYSPCYLEPRRSKLWPSYGVVATSSYYGAHSLFPWGGSRLFYAPSSIRTYQADASLPPLSLPCSRAYCTTNSPHYTIPHSRRLPLAVLRPRTS